MNEEHIVLLSKQAIELLKQVKELTSQYDLVFPGSHDHRKPMSENTLTYAVRNRLGYFMSSDAGQPQRIIPGANDQES